MELGAVAATGVRVGYLLELGRLGLEFSAGFLMSPLKEDAAPSRSNASYLFTYRAGIGISGAIWRTFRVSGTFMIGAMTLTGASSASAFFGSELYSSVSGNFTVVNLGPELSLSWRPWRGLVIQLTPLALDYSPPHDAFTDEISYLLRIQVGGGLGWLF